MAIYNEIMTGRYARMLQKLFGIKGNVPAKQLAGEISTAFPLFSGVEHRYLESWDRYAAGVVVSAAAANGSGWRFRNPSASNIIAVFEKIQIDGNTGGTAATYIVSSGLMGIDLATPVGVTSTRVDPRGRPNPALIVSQQNSVAGAIAPLGAQYGRVFLNSSGNYDWIITENQEIQLLPGDALQITCQVVNVAMEGACVWRERFLEESERA